MKIFIGLIVSVVVVCSCVPAKRYNELLEKEQKCSEELAKFKTDALNFEAKAADLEAKLDVLTGQVSSLKKDTADIGQRYRTLIAKYNKMSLINGALENNYDKLRLSGARETAILHADLLAKQLELQRKEDALMELEKELLAKQHLLSNREQRVRELEDIISAQDDAVALLKEKIANALRGFENKGLTVEEKNGKIYVSLEAKLLFASGSTAIEEGGKVALIDLARVLEGESELEIVVEGHTDTDKLAGTKHPKTNWELSVLRSTAVIEIMMGNSTIDPKQLMAAGRSEFLPVDKNNKAKNRRIEIIISPNLNALYELISQ